MAGVRSPAVAGMFYPGAPGSLAQQVGELLDGARLEEESSQCPRALVVPHAGYVYSGAVAAAAYVQLRPHRARLRRVVLIGPSHRVAFEGIAVCAADVYRTPLGDVPLDVTTARALVGQPGVQVLDAAHQDEHSLEVQLPFLQQVLDDFLLLPLVVGRAPAAAVAEVMAPFLDDPATVVVVSSDLSHYLDYATAQRVDHATCSAIEQLAGELIGDEQACGRYPLKGLLLAARRRDLAPVTLKLCNSGDSAGDRRRVVGYGAWAFYGTPRPCA